MADANLSPEETAAARAEKAAKGGGQGLARRATRSLRRARTTYEGNDWKDSTEASFLLQEANVLAVMDLAEAVREQRDSS
jgi:hypothetical protein